MGLLNRARAILPFAPPVVGNGGRVSVVVTPSGGVVLAEHEQVIPRSPVTHPTVVTMTLLYGSRLTFSQYAMGMN